VRRRARIRGEPRSANGASSLHLWWELPGAYREVAVTLEILLPPTVPRLYFWALQVSFTDGRRVAGGAHLGLQSHPRHPGGTAVNWGGYRSGGGELEGSVSSLPSALDNRNTRDYPWVPGRPYRLRVAPSTDQGWRGSVTDLATGRETVVRDLYLPGPAPALSAPVVWSEVFARCDHPSTVVEWSDLEAVTEGGRAIGPAAVRVGYQRRADGGCDNTTALADPDGTATGVRQITGTPRVVAPGAVLRLDQRRS
jgi:hypothetical protein